MTRHLPDAGSYAPVTILIEELPGGGTRVAYDTVSSAIAPYGDAAASQVAERLDAEVLGNSGTTSRWSKMPPPPLARRRCTPLTPLTGRPLPTPSSRQTS
jgi:hypothetical protein